MTEYILFYLWGPLQSWGSIAVGSDRPTDAVPSKSAVVGMIAASLGIRRSQKTDNVMRAIDRGLDLAVRVDSRGVRGVDYQTIQSVELKRGFKVRTRYDELVHARKMGQEIGTILSSREYLQDAAYLLAIRAKRQHINPSELGEWSSLFSADGAVSLNRVAQALIEPKFVLSLGRKSCPAGIPIRPVRVEAVSFSDAVRRYPMELIREFLALKPGARIQIIPPIGEQREVCWEGHDPELQPSKELIRRDGVVSRSKWQFSERIENLGVVTIES